ncbi:type I DNA topoisomerase [Dishui Lake large algae virus 1]|nr:type I DNA topoisomerase [Dishui Lake large algae virus 1]
MGTKKNLVIVESGAKAKTIQKILVNATELKHLGTFQVTACMGHVVDLPPKEIGIDTEAWVMKYVPITGKGDVIKKLKELARGSDMVYLAADPDREGEAIAKNIYDLLGLKQNSSKRVAFHEITKRAITEAMLNPRDIDHKLVDAQEARRMLDRLVGYKLSPLLWRRFSGEGLSAGRVQSVALRLAVERAREINDFVPEGVWCVNGSFSIGTGTKGEEVDTRLAVTIKNKKEVETLMKELARKGGVAAWSASYSCKESTSNPSAPFTTSSLQQEAYSRHRMGAKKVMQLAQALYEAGHITYMRTDSTALSDEAKKMVHTYIVGRFGDNAVVDRNFKTKVANAQEAHECIRPTHVDKLPGDITQDDKLTPEHARLYDLVWRRTVASQMKPAVYTELLTSIAASTVQMPVLNGRPFVGTVRVLVEKGYLDVWQPDTEAQPELAKKLWKKAGRDNGKGGSARALGFSADGDVTHPPSLYNEPGLVKALEKEGIGRPSTYASIIDKVFSKAYVVRGSNPRSVQTVTSYTAIMEDKKVLVEDTKITIGGNDNDRIVPTPLGERVTGYLEETAARMVDVGFTADMENSLDLISRGEMEKNGMLGDFYSGLEEIVEKALASHKQAQKNKAAADGTGKSESDGLRPKKIIRSIRDGVDVVQTRYGLALYICDDKKFISITPFMEWKGKTTDDLSNEDADFLMRLPIVYKAEAAADTEPIEIAIGRYGIYAKHDGANRSISRSMWDKIYNGSTSYNELQEDINLNLQQKKEQKGWKKWGAAGKRKWVKKPYSGQ